MCRSLCSSPLDLTWQRHRGRMSDSDLGFVACTAFSSHQAHPPQRGTTQHFVWSGNNIYNIFALFYLCTAFSSLTHYTTLCNIWKQRRTLHNTTVNRDNICNVIILCTRTKLTYVYISAIYVLTESDICFDCKDSKSGACQCRTVQCIWIDWVQQCDVAKSALIGWSQCRRTRLTSLGHFHFLPGNKCTWASLLGQGGRSSWRYSWKGQIVSRCWLSRV